MKFVLIVILAGHPSMPMVSAEFNTREACIDAAEAVLKRAAVPNVKYVCASKGKEENG